MKKSILFAALCCVAAVFVACDKNEPKDGSNNNDPKNDTKEAVDLGLSVKWATCNVGATSPEKYGNHYAWGETSTKSDYSWATYKYGTYNYDGDYSKLTKYNATDGKTTLEAVDDAATVNWGSAWRIPTDDEWAELITNCTWTWATKNGVSGYEVKASNGNAIFLPAAGYRYDDNLHSVGYDGLYLSSSLYTDSLYGAWNAGFYSSHVYRHYYDRCYGHSVRPVVVP